jgi:hypothetical protein
MFDLQRRHGVAAAPDLVFPLLSLLVIEGTVRDLDPGVDFRLGLESLGKDCAVEALDDGARPLGVETTPALAEGDRRMEVVQQGHESHLRVAPSYHAGLKNRTPGLLAPGFAADRSRR